MVDIKFNIHVYFINVSDIYTCICCTSDDVNFPARVVNLLRNFSLLGKVWWITQEAFVMFILSITSSVITKGDKKYNQWLNDKKQEYM